MKKHKKKISKVLLATLISVCMATPTVGCMEDWDDEEWEDSDWDSEESDGGETSTSVNNLGTNPDDAPDEGSWTIFVYLCGSDLESDGGAATGDITEMINGSKDSDYTYVLQTGGANEWSYDYEISSDALERYQINNGEIEMVDSVSNDNMGDGSVLTDFLSWGLSNYESDNYGLVFWNHGGGSITGVCFDEQNDYDSLSLREIDQSLSSINADFEFIGFDACLMASIETANILKNYANYMVASEETEPGSGWDYEKIGNYLAKHVGANGAMLGSVICDSFYKSCEAVWQEDTATLSVIDLSKLDTFIKAFNVACADLSNNVGDVDNMKVISNGVKKAENYGGNTPSEGYTNMVDVGDILDNVSSVISNCVFAKKMLNDLVVYQVKGKSRSKASGLSIYYPLEVQGSNELNVFADLTVSRNYLSFVNKMVYGMNYGSLNGYVDTVDISADEYLFADSETEEQVDISSDVAEGTETDFDYVDDVSADDAETQVVFAQDAYINDEGIYTFQIKEDTLGYVGSVQYSLFADWFEDEDSMIYLGSDNNVSLYDDGTVEDNFDGTWAALPDGQLLTYYTIEEAEGYTLFSAPIYLNGEETNLRFIYNYEKQAYEILGAWAGIDDETGVSAKDLVKIKAGDVIVPLYYLFDLESDNDETLEGEEYTVGSNFVIEDMTLPEADYYYAFEVIDVYGISTMTDFTVFNVDEDGEVYFYEE